MNISQHNLYTFSNDESSIDIGLNELAIDTYTGAVYAKNKYGNLIQLGDSLRYLTQYSIYDIDKVYSPVNYSFLQFYIKDGAFRLIDRIPELNLYDLDGYTYIENIDNHYLGFTGNSLLNINQPQYNLIDLVDVSISGTQKIASNDNKVLSFSYGFRSSNSKDYFIDQLGATYGSWSLKPETSTLKGFDNVFYSTEAAYQVMIAPSTTSGFSALLRNTELDISYDVSPELSNDLDAGAFKLYNYIYKSNYIVADDYLILVTLDENPIITINCNNKDYIQLNFIPVTTVNNIVKYYTLVLLNFDGALSMNAKFENGKGLVLENKTHILTLVISYSNVGIDIMCLQKATNLS